MVRPVENMLVMNILSHAKTVKALDEFAGELEDEEATKEEMELAHTLIGASTIEEFDYLEELTFSHVGKPFLAMTQRTRDPRSDAPLHAEVGYLRPQPSRGIEMVLTQPTGVVEIHTGSITEVRRRLEVTGDTLVSEMWMAAMGQPLTHHLRAELVRA